MPRLSAAQEQQVRDWIIRAAVEVFSEKGYHRDPSPTSSVSGLSVGTSTRTSPARRSCSSRAATLISGQGLDELAIRLAPLTSTADRLHGDVYYVEIIDEFQGAPGQVGLVRAWAEAGEEPGVREMLARRRERLVGAAQLLLRQGIAGGELPPCIDVDGLARGSWRCWTVSCSSASRPAIPIVPRIRSAEPPRSSTCCSRRRRSSARRCPRRSIGRRWPTSRPSSDRSTPGTRVHSAARAHPHSSGTCPAGGTTGSSPATSRSLEELAAYREAGGSGMVDPTRPASGGTRPGLPGRCIIRVARRHGLRLVSRRLLARGAHRLALRRRPRRRAGSRGDGGGRRYRYPWNIGEIGIDKPWVSALEERVHRAAARAARRTGQAITTHGVLSAVGLDQPGHRGRGRRPGAGRHRPCRSFPRLDHYLAIVERGANLEFDFLGMSFTPSERLGEGRIVELLWRSSWSRARRAHHDVAGRPPRPQLELRGNGYTYPRRRSSCVCARRVSARPRSTR